MMNKHDIEFYSTRSGKIELIKKLKYAICEARKLNKLVNEMHEMLDANRLRKAA